ncbi:uncharacterized protein PADG_11082 [Paracoccidioides brasiliensis Pb18]|uniref:Uncharacterized protein n=1 Tax=Paracoccidioides brasiliensis (strain Pb18) TaxID=502780 RepID=A0A0A0HVN5_PARBD|nr:uncharacterized protein PADG_11082 [Paracoccidioides brasiliensis Pb18]KGM92632.1 hypothetical protein PADG_11082 [Paracoccidioides brasiliensis Pb18]
MFWMLQTYRNPQQLHQQANKIKYLVKGQSQGFVEDFDQIIKACEHGMVSTTILKKQYQDIFNVNEIEKQNLSFNLLSLQFLGLDHTQKHHSSAATAIYLVKREQDALNLV